MASVAQIQANRSNAQKSTGPRTAAGKERASRNALKHGLLAREAVIPGEDPEEFELFREGMIDELAPVGAVETMLAQRVVSLSWRLRRAERLQNAAFAALDEGEPTPLLEARHEEWKQLKGNEWERSLTGLFDEDAALGKIVVDDFGGARVLDRLLVYERRIENSLYRTMAELRRERDARTTPAEPEATSRSEGCPPVGQKSMAPVKLGSFGANLMSEDAARGEEVSSGGVGPAPAPRVMLVATETSVATATVDLSATPEGVSRSEGGLAAGQESATLAELASFGAGAAPEERVEEVSRLKCHVPSGGEQSSAEGPVSSNGSDFALETSHFPLPKITPYGVTTNLPAAGGNHGRDARATGTPYGPGSSPGQAPPAKAGVTTNDEGRATRPPAETLYVSRFTTDRAKRTQCEESVKFEVSRRASLWSGLRTSHFTLQTRPKAGRAKEQSTPGFPGRSVV